LQTVLFGNNTTERRALLPAFLLPATVMPLFLLYFDKISQISFAPKLWRE